MSPPDDPRGEMHWSPLDERTADALLDGRVAARDLPRALHPLHEVIRQAAAPVGRAPLPGEEELVRAFAAAVGPVPGVSSTSTRRKPMLTRLLTLKAAAAAAAVLFGSGVAAAATGALPGPMQTVAAHSLASVGWSVPDPGHATTHGHAVTTTTQPSTTTVPSTTTTPPIVNSSNLPGLCTAYNASTSGGTETSKPNLGSTAFSALAATASAKGESVEQLCAGVATGSNGTPHGSSTAPVPSTQPTLPPEATQPHGNSSSSGPGHSTSVPGSAHASVSGAAHAGGGAAGTGVGGTTTTSASASR